MLLGLLLFGQADDDTAYLMGSYCHGDYKRNQAIPDDLELSTTIKGDTVFRFKCGSPLEMSTAGLDLGMRRYAEDVFSACSTLDSSDSPKVDVAVTFGDAYSHAERYIMKARVPLFQKYDTSAIMAKTRFHFCP